MVKQKFTVDVEMEERWVPHFISMLNRMERLGNMGSSRTVGMFADGDGDFRPKFKFNYGGDFKEKYPKTRKEKCEVYDAG